MKVLKVEWEREQHMQSGRSCRRRSNESRINWSTVEWSICVCGRSLWISLLICVVCRVTSVLVRLLLPLSLFRFIVRKHHHHYTFIPSGHCRICENAFSIHEIYVDLCASCMAFNANDGGCVCTCVCVCEFACRTELTSKYVIQCSC